MLETFRGRLLAAQQSSTAEDGSATLSSPFLIDLELVPLRPFDAISRISSGQEKPDLWLVPGKALIDLNNSSIINLGAPMAGCEASFVSPVVAVSTSSKGKPTSEIQIRSTFAQAIEDVKPAFLLHANPLISVDGLGAQSVLLALGRDENRPTLLSNLTKLESFSKAYGASGESLLTLLPQYSQNTEALLLTTLAEIRNAKRNANVGAVDTFHTQRIVDMNPVLRYFLCQADADWVTQKKKIAIVDLREFFEKSLAKEFLSVFGFEATSADQQEYLEEQDLPFLTKEWVAIQNPLSLIISIDLSGSMDGEPLSNVQSALRTLLGHFPATGTIGLVSFSHSADLLLAPEPLSPNFFSIFDKLRAGGGSALYDSVRLAVDALKGEDGILPAHGRKSVLLITDGNDLNSQINLPNLESTLRNVSLGKNLSLTIVAIQNGSTNMSDLRRLSQSIDGAFYEETLATLPKRLEALSLSW